MSSTLRPIIDESVRLDTSIGWFHWRRWHMGETKRRMGPRSSLLHSASVQIPTVKFDFYFADAAITAERSCQPDWRACQFHAEATPALAIQLPIASAKRQRFKEIVGMLPSRPALVAAPTGLVRSLIKLSNKIRIQSGRKPFHPVGCG